MLSHWESNNNDKYRYGYQGEYSEKDEETGYNHFELRAYDSRIGRWMIPDPYGQYYSPYVAMGNNPIGRVDPDGGEDINGDGIDDGTLLGDVTVTASSLVWFQDLLDGTVHSYLSVQEQEIIYTTPSASLPKPSRSKQAESKIYSKSEPV